MRIYKAVVTMEGQRHLLFDKYHGMDAKPELIDKVYWANGIAVIPQANLYSGLTAENTKSVVRLVAGKKAKNKGMAIQQQLYIKQFDIPITQNGKEIARDDFDKYFIAVQHVARTKAGTPNDKIRPCLQTPWQLQFDISFIETADLSWAEMKRYLTELGRLGIGTYRPLYGGANVTIEVLQTDNCEEFSADNAEEQAA